VATRNRLWRGCMWRTGGCSWSRKGIILHITHMLFTAFFFYCPSIQLISFCTLLFRTRKAWKLNHSSCSRGGVLKRPKSLRAVTQHRSIARKWWAKDSMSKKQKGILCLPSLNIRFSLAYLPSLNTCWFCWQGPCRQLRGCVRTAEGHSEHWWSDCLGASSFIRLLCILGGSGAVSTRWVRVSKQNEEKRKTRKHKQTTRTHIDIRCTKCGYFLFFLNLFSLLHD
jgi:hypothetical protein